MGRIFSNYNRSDLSSNGTVLQQFGFMSVRLCEIAKAASPKLKSLWIPCIYIANSTNHKRAMLHVIPHMSTVITKFTENVFTHLFSYYIYVHTYE